MTKKVKERKITLSALIRSVDPDFYKKKQRDIAYVFSNGRIFYTKKRT